MPRSRSSAVMALTALLLVSFLYSLASGVQIGPSAFSSAAVVQRFDNLNLPLQNLGSLILAGDTYSTLSGVYRYQNDWGSLMGRSGGGIGTDSEGDYIDIQLGTPALLAGLYTGSFPRAWSASASFYDSSGTQLALLQTAGQSGESNFLGWKTDSNLITRIRVTDTDSSNFEVAVIDDVIQERVPEPGALLLLSSVLLPLLALRTRHFARWRRRTLVCPWSPPPPPRCYCSGCWRVYQGGVAD
jgi:hypothetical protein